jgi:N-carbamoyl-L-amino-acid hydrolase
MILPGLDRKRAGVVIGSHLDSVPRGGNYDGLAGVVAGLVVATAMARLGCAPAQDLIIMGIRAEESAWFGTQHVGSRAALGLLAPALLDSARRIDTGRSLGSHMEAAGIDTGAIREGRAWLTNKTTRSYLELHIEQGPILDNRNLAVGIVTGIRGNVRCPEVHCRGQYAHSGAVPRELRRDAVSATTALVGEMERYWSDAERAGEDMVITFGRFFTDPQLHNLTTIPGELTFSFDARSRSAATLNGIKKALLASANEIAHRTSVEFAWQPFSQSAPVDMDAALSTVLAEACERVGVPTMQLPSGAGHDAQDFVEAGIPSAMIFVRNTNGSHNPDEHLAMDDLRTGTRVLFEAVRSMS